MDLELEPGCPEVVCKESAVALGSKKCIFSVNLSVAVLSPVGKISC